jgi:hypothetical protein
VAKGFSQVAGIDYDELYAGVAHKDSIRVLLSLLNHLDLECDQVGRHQEALSGPQQQQEKAAMDRELTNLRMKETWQEVKAPQDRAKIGARWVLKIKREPKAISSSTRHDAGHHPPYLQYNALFLCLTILCLGLVPWNLDTFRTLLASGETFPSLWCRINPSAATIARVLTVAPWTIDGKVREEPRYDERPERPTH